MPLLQSNASSVAKMGWSSNIKRIYFLEGTYQPSFAKIITSIQSVINRLSLKQKLPDLSFIFFLYSSALLVEITPLISGPKRKKKVKNNATSPKKITKEIIPILWRQTSTLRLFAKNVIKE